MGSSFHRLEQRLTRVLYKRLEALVRSKVGGVVSVFWGLAHFLEVFVTFHVMSFAHLIIGVLQINVVLSGRS